MCVSVFFAGFGGMFRCLGRMTVSRLGMMCSGLVIICFVALCSFLVMRSGVLVVIRSLLVMLLHCSLIFRWCLCHLNPLEKIIKITGIDTSKKT